jgi:hypothetical protein
LTEGLPICLFPVGKQKSALGKIVFDYPEDTCNHYDNRWKSGGDEMKTYTLCGSMRFEKEMMETAFLLETQNGFNILQCTYTDKELSAEEQSQLVRSHYRKIDISDGIYVLNIDGYIGASVAEEIRYAKQMRKEILYHCPGFAEEELL